jgi:hypothetical protein
LTILTAIDIIHTSPNNKQKKGTEMAVCRSEATGVVYVRPMREFKEKFKEFDVGI